MRRTILLAALASALSAACASSHGASDAGVDAARDAAQPADAAAEGADAPADADGPASKCRARCTVEPLVTATLERPGDDGWLEILGASPSGSSTLSVLVSRTSAPPSIPEYEPFWYRVQLDLDAGSVGPVQGGRGPLVSGPDSPSTAFDAAIIRSASDSAVALFRPQGTGGAVNDAKRVRAAYLRWTGGDGELERTDLGPVVTLPDPPGLWEASLFELPDGDLVAATEYGGTLHAARIAWEPGAMPEIADRVELGSAGEAGLGMAALSGAPAPDGRWALAGGGRTDWDSRTAFAALAEPDGLVWAEPLGGSRSDPPPHVVGTPDGASVVRWEQNPADTADTAVVARRFGPGGLSRRVRVSTAPVPLPLDAHVIRTEGGMYALWNVRAPDDATDGLLHGVLFEAGDECPATGARRLARLPGETPRPASIHAVQVDGALVLLALAPLGDDTAELSALRVSCHAEAG